MKLNYKVLGEGSPLVILHGLFGSLDNWMTLAKKWSDQYQVILVDQRNHGQSPHSDDFSYPIMAADLKELMDDLNISTASFLGHSMGGKTVMEFSMQFPEMIDNLIVVDIAPVKYEVHHYGIIDALKSVPVSRISSRKEAETFLKKQISEPGTRQFLLKNLYWKEKERLAWRFNLDVLAKEIIPISEYAIREGFFDKGTLFVSGGNSDYVLPEYGARIHEKFPHYQLEIIKGAGHWVHAERMSEFSAIIEKFLSE